MKLNYPYYSIEITGRHMSLSIAPPDVQSIHILYHFFGKTQIYSTAQKTKQASQFLDIIQETLDAVRQNYPDDTWLSITFYDDCFDVTETYEASCENNYYCNPLNKNIYAYIKDFVMDNLT